ncbi:MAG: NAD(P)-dependent oxidoreductase [Spirochaetales bacterium]|nr:NAD(P)-dependent oxidoreductase [Spirochaetales bacterium]
MKNILITGANGKIGSKLRDYFDGSGGAVKLRLGDLTLADGEESIELDVTDLESCRKACVGIDVVIHLAGLASPETPFDRLLPVNILGTNNIFQAALEAGVKRIIYASSAQTIEGYPLDVQVKTEMPVRPKNLYGVSKACGEAMGAFYAYQKGLEVIAVRIGAFEYKEDWEKLDSRDMSAWLDPDDFCDLIQGAIEADLTGEPFKIVHGISDNRFKRLDISDTKSTLGYNPQADSFEEWGVRFSESSLRLDRR